MNANDKVRWGLRLVGAMVGAGLLAALRHEKDLVAPHAWFFMAASVAAMTEGLARHLAKQPRKGWAGPMLGMVMGSGVGVAAAGGYVVAMVGVIGAYVVFPLLAFSLVLMPASAVAGGVLGALCSGLNATVTARAA